MRLEFTADEAGDRHLRTLYDGLVNSPRGYKVPHETRIIQSVLSRLETLGVRTPTGTLSLVEPGGFDLSRTEYSLVKEAFEAVTWTGKGAADAHATWEWMTAAADRGDAKEAKAE